MGEYEVRRTTTIAAPPSAIYERIVDLRRWTEWSPWEGVDPALEREYSEPSAGLGASYGWRGNRKAGEGSMTITALQEDAEVALALAFLKPFKSESTVRFLLTPGAAGTEVAWVMTGRNDSLVSKVFSRVVPMDKIVGKDFEKGLAALKARSEQAASQAPDELST